MKIAILANNDDSFIKSLAEGLHRMFQQLHIPSIIYYDGLKWLGSPPCLFSSRIVSGRIFTVFGQTIQYLRFFKTLHAYDALIVVGGIPTMFMKDRCRNVEYFRNKLNIPIIHYSHYYLATRGSWITRLRSGDPALGIPRGNYGLERYDWYLAGSVGSDYPLSKDKHPYSRIGVNLDDGTLLPEPGKTFRALIDFERPDYMKERAVQIEALEASNTPYTVLHGKYTIKEIREIYRNTSLYFLATHESFGLPICELQACGSYVFSPYKNWCPSHYIDKDLHVAGEGDLSPNFIMYNNDKEFLIHKIREIKGCYDAQQVRNTFLTYHPQFYYGDKKELGHFVEMLENGQIHPSLHQEHVKLNDSIVTEI